MDSDIADKWFCVLYFDRDFVFDTSCQNSLVIKMCAFIWIVIYVFARFCFAPLC